MQKKMIMNNKITLESDSHCPVCVAVYLGLQVNNASNCHPWTMSDCTVHCYTDVLCVSVCLRLQVNPQNKSEFSGISPERGFADFIFAHVILHLVVMNFIG